MPDSALAGLTITYMVGFEIVPMLAEEIKSSRARLGYIQTMGSMGMGTVQILCALGMVTLIPYHMFASMANTEMNIPAAAMEMAPDLLPVFVVKIILGAAILSSFATCLSAITGFTRSIYVLGRDQRLPKVFSYLHPKYKTPVASIVLCFVLGILGSIQREIVSYAFALVMAAMFMYILIPISHIILRKKEPNTIRPVKTPFYPIINIIASTWAAYMFYYQVKTVPLTVWYFLFAAIGLGIVFKGALTTPGTEKPIAIVDIGAGSTDASYIFTSGKIKSAHLAGAGDMVTMVINSELGLNDVGLAENIKIFPLAKSRIIISYTP